MISEQKHLPSRYPLSSAQIQSYRDAGFIQLNDVFVGKELRRLRDAVAAAVALEADKNLVGQPTDVNRSRGTYTDLFIQRVNLWTRHSDVRPFVLSERLANIAACLEGAPMRLWHDQALFKEPRTGNNKTPWHQDAVYWPHTQRRQQTTIWIALKDSTVQNGCMAFVAGSHKLGALPRIDLAHPQDIFQYAPKVRPVKPRVCPLKAGSVTVHSGLTFHCAGPNRSDTVREAFAVIYMPDGTRFDGAGHVVTDPLGLRAGTLLDAELFPLVSYFTDET